MPVAGRQLTYGWALALCSYVGFEYGHGLIRAVAVMTGESARYVEATHVNENGTIDRGAFQINSIHDEQLSPTDALEAIPNAHYAYQLSRQGTDFSPWAAYNNKSRYYIEGLVAAQFVYATGPGWRKRIVQVPRELG